MKSLRSGPPGDRKDYLFAADSFANKMAFVFGGEKGEAEAAAFNLLQLMGIRVERENVTTRCEKGPPQVVTIYFNIRPTENLGKKDSAINALADS